MPSTVIFNDFKTVNLSRNRYRRSTYQLWDANTHHGEVRPFNCPEAICDDVFTQRQQLYYLPDCPCYDRGYDFQMTNGFCNGQYLGVDQGILVHARSSELCGNNVVLDRAGAPTPTEAPSILNPIPNNSGSCDAVAVSYVYTYVVEHLSVQVESAPSPPSEMFMGDGTQPNVDIFIPQPPPNSMLYSLVAIRLYRVESDFEDATDSMSPDGSEYLLVSQFAVSNSAITFNDNLITSSTGAPLTTYAPMAFVAPTALVSMTRTLDGVAVADRHRVYISVPGQAQFTFDGVVEIDDEIQRIVSINNTIFVLTNNRPVKLGYRHTDGIMSIDKQIIERRIPLLSTRSVSVYDGKVFFASVNSLYVWDISGYGSDIGTSLTALMTPEQWRNIAPEDVVGIAHEFGYLFTSSNIDYSLMLELGGDKTDTRNMTSITPISYINSVTSFALDYNGIIMYNSVGAGVFRWDWRGRLANNLNNLYDNIIPDKCDDCCPWTIEFYIDNEGKNRFSKMRVEWDERSASNLQAAFYIESFGQREQVASFDVVSSRGFSIPKFLSGQSFCVEVSGCGIMHEVRLATSNQELVSNSNNLKQV